MARDPSKTEKPTPKKIRDARKEGQVARSMEVSSAMILLASLMFFYFGGQWFMTTSSRLLQNIFQNYLTMDLGADGFYQLVLFSLQQFLLLLAPLMAGLAVVGVLANVLQVGFMLSSKPIAPKFSKINPVTGFGRIFSLRSLVDLFKSLFKIIVLGYVAFTVYRAHFHEFFGLLNQPVAEILRFLAAISFQILWRCGLVLTMLAIFDYLYQRWEWTQDLKMTKDEVKDEFKQMEGDPQLKARIRSLQMAAARQRMMQEVPRADVVITNPVHLAVALLYDKKKSAAPLVVAKGAGVIAENIKKVARQHQVPIMENKPLARVLFKMVNINEMIPADLYQAVAEILAHVYRLKGKKL
ncbi:MAG: flagellar biosynthesis protein FlhB [Deltaproteobacteria bacterium]|nr:flagellar biosynthesis protein FlhB [Candidatus Anaeroferrophillus wilburensis]MBN2889590.1 flagellar biosynthesis protein FlhB [Deltaproteobacteria bacterium]